MSKETKFGYGFLLVGTGMPYLIDRLFGLSFAILISIACVIVGCALLYAGHWHKENQATRIWNWLAIGACLSTLIVLSWLGVMRILPKSEARPVPPSQEVKKEPPPIDALKPSVESSSAAKPKFRPIPKSSSDTLKLLAGLSDQQLGIEADKMINDLKGLWENYWNGQDNMLWFKERQARTEQERKEIAKKRNALLEKVWNDNQSLFSDAIAIRDECLKPDRPDLAEKGKKLKTVIGRFYDLEYADIQHARQH